MLAEVRMFVPLMSCSTDDATNPVGVANVWGVFSDSLGPLPIDGFERHRDLPRNRKFAGLSRPVCARRGPGIPPWGLSFIWINHQPCRPSLKPCHQSIYSPPRGLLTPGGFSRRSTSGSAGPRSKHINLDVWCRKARQALTLPPRGSPW